jgi:hypothetical protein
MNNRKQLQDDRRYTESNLNYKIKLLLTTQSVLKCIVFTDKYKDKKARKKDGNL